LGGGLLTISSRGIIVRKAIHDDGEERPDEEDDVCEEADGAEPEGTVADGVPAADEEGDDGDSVGDVEEDDAGCDHAVIETDGVNYFIFGIVVVGRGGEGGSWGWK
jgi:hypothetical protein